MITFPGSLAAAITQPTVELRLLARLETLTGTHRWAWQEGFPFAGFYYHPRLMSAPDLFADVGGVGAGVPTARSITVEVANADGFYSDLRPGDYQGRRFVVEQVLRDVDSVALRRWGFTVTNALHTRRDGALRFNAEDQWREAGRRLVPRHVLTTSMYPNLPPENQGRAMTWLHGRTLCPLVLVDEVTDVENRFFACTGSASIGSTSAAVVEEFAGTLFVVESWRLERNVRDGIPVTEVLIRSPIRQNGTGPVTMHYADLMSHHGSEMIRPDHVLLDLLFSDYGAHAERTAVDSDSLLAAASFYAVRSLGFAFAMTQQVALEDLLGAWAHDALTYVQLRDRVYLTPLGSRAPVTSLHVGSILRDSWTFEDAAQVEGTHRTVYVDRTRAVARFEEYAAGSGTVREHPSPFIGTPMVAQIVSQQWAKRGAYPRAYTLDTSIRHAALEPGDPVSLTHSLMDAQDRLVEVTRVGALGGRVPLGLQEFGYEVFTTVGPPQDPAFRRIAQQIFATRAASYALSPALNSAGFTSSHGLYSAPVYARPVWTSQAFAPLVTMSLTLANDSVFTVLFFATGSVPNLQSALQYVDLRLAST